MSSPADPPEIAHWRADTPGSERVIHLNNAGAALQPTAVLDAVLRHLELEQEIGGYEAADARVDALRDAYEAVGRLIGASGRNVAMQQSSTVAFAQAFAAFDLRRGNLILTSRADYASNQIMYLALSRRVGVEGRHSAHRVPGRRAGPGRTRGRDRPAGGARVDPAPAPDAAGSQLDPDQFGIGPARRADR